VLDPEPEELLRAVFSSKDMIAKGCPMRWHGCHGRNSRERVE